MPPKRVVFDTNIWVSFIIKAKLDELVHLVFEYDLIVFSSPVLLEELKEVLSRPKFSKYLTLPVKEYVDFHLEIVQISPTTPKFSTSPDPKDNFLFDLAFQAECACIITGDKKLLAIQKVENVEIMTLADFYKVIH